MTQVFAIVLGAAVWPGGQPSPTLRRRAERAAALWQAGQVGGIVATGGVGRNPPSEAEAVRGVVTGLGVPAGAVLVEDRSTTTLENLRFAKALLPAGAAVVVVSDGWHLPRALRMARRLGLNATGAATPLTGARLAPTLRNTLREAAALGWDLLRRPR